MKTIVVFLHWLVPAQVFSQRNDSLPIRQVYGLFRMARVFTDKFDFEKTVSINAAEKELICSVAGYGDAIRAGSASGSAAG